MIIAYDLGGNSSNDAEFYDGTEPAETLCPVCQRCINSNYVPAFLNVSKSKKYDVAYTHDLQTVFSERFVTFCKEVLKADEEFIPIKTPHSILYYMLPRRQLELDSERKKLEYGKQCSECDQYEGVYGPYPICLKQKAELKTGFYRTDLGFSDGKNNHPLLIVGTEWKLLLAAQKFRGLTFEAISD